MRIDVESLHSRQVLATFARRFTRNEEGSASVEVILWMPIMALVLAVIMNISLVFFGESQMLRVVQDANRAFSLGRFADMDETEQYVINQLAYLGATLSVNSTFAGGFITTSLTAPATDLMPLNFMQSAFNGVNVTVSAQQIVEF